MTQKESVLNVHIYLIAEITGDENICWRAASTCSIPTSTFWLFLDNDFTLTISAANLQISSALRASPDTAATYQNNRYTYYCDLKLQALYIK